ncbi:MAG: hypothetical protein KJN84_11030, partial [Bacteroidia bacterium]|nr:hypothetical protein [Bacteroidia bacterium]
MQPSKNIRHSSQRILDYISFFLLIFFFCLSNYSIAQVNPFSLCPGTSRADARIESYSDDIQLFGIDYSITTELRIFDPTCPQKKDGEVRMNVFINGRNALGIEDVKLDITKYSIGG